jgi:anti-anti-sigma factor
MTGSYEIVRLGSNCKVVVRGPLTAILVPEVKEALNKQVQQGISGLVFDLKETTMLDSSGIGLLIASSNTVAQTGGTLRVINPGKEIFQLLSNIRLVSRLHVRPAMEAAHGLEEELIRESQEHLASRGK